MVHPEPAGRWLRDQRELLSTMGDQVEAQARYSKALATALAISQHDPQDMDGRHCGGTSRLQVPSLVN
jgi:hypothetical protein